ncbi:unnamed protein product, partial [marine sediment metagenome]
MIMDVSRSAARRALTVTICIIMAAGLITWAVFMAGCASSPLNNTAVPTIIPPQEVKITITSADPAKVDISTEDKIHRSMEIENPNGELSNLTFISAGKAYIKIFSGLSTSDVTHLWNDFIVLDAMDVKDAHIFINSPGGAVFAGIALADEILRARADGFTVTGHASGIVASAAVPVFAVCTTRFASIGTVFMVHQASMFKYGYENSDDLRAQTEMMEL